MLTSIDVKFIFDSARLGLFSVREGNALQGVGRWFEEFKGS